MHSSGNDFDSFNSNLKFGGVGRSKFEDPQKLFKITFVLWQDDFFSKWNDRKSFA